MVYRQTQLYKFLDYCNKSDLEKKVLDCGAGGNMPPLGMFYSEGYKTYGVELSDSQIELSKVFENEHDMDLNIIKCDMRKMPFKDEEMSFIYSYGSIFHMPKKDIGDSIKEIKRILKKNGLCFISFLSKKDIRYGQGKKVAEDEFLEEEYGENVVHSYFDTDEGDSYFKDMDVLYKEVRLFERIYEGKKIKQCYIDYIVKKS